MKSNNEPIMTIHQLQAIKRAISFVVDSQHKRLHYEILGLFSDDPTHHEHQTALLKNLMQQDRMLKEAESAMCDLFDMQFQQE